MTLQPQERCVILKPSPAASWKAICAVSVIGFYAMPGLDERYLSEYRARVGTAAQSLLEFARKDVDGDAKLTWKTDARTMAQMAEMGATDDVESTWAVCVGVSVEFAGGDPGPDVARSFGDAWIPRFSSVMQFHVPFDEAPALSILDGDPDYALLLQR